MKNEKGLALPAFFLVIHHGCAREGGAQGGSEQGGSEHGEALVVGVKAEGFGAVVVGLRKGAEACVA